MGSVKGKYRKELKKLLWGGVVRGEMGRVQKTHERLKKLFWVVEKGRRGGGEVSKTLLGDTMRRVKKILS